MERSFNHMDILIRSSLPTAEIPELYCATTARPSISQPITRPDRTDELSRIQAAGRRVIYWDGPRVLGSILPNGWIRSVLFRNEEN
ncbi:unnamed protein product [Camellia sinensis]